jgi:hypothetical protein
VGEVDDRLRVGGVLDRDAADQRRQHGLPLQVRDELGQGLDRDHVDAVDEGGFGGIDGRDEDGTHAALAGQADHRQDALEMAKRAVKGELAEEDDPAGVGGDLLGCQQHADGDRQVVRRPRLAHLGRRQVHRDPSWREDHRAISHRCADSLPSFLNGGVGQPDDRQPRDSLTGDVDFDLHELALQANDGAGPDLSQHGGLR